MIKAIIFGIVIFIFAIILVLVPLIIHKTKKRNENYHFKVIPPNCFNYCRCLKKCQKSGINQYCNLICGSDCNPNDCK